MDIYCFQTNEADNHTSSWFSSDFHVNCLVSPISLLSCCHTWLVNMEICSQSNNFRLSFTLSGLYSYPWIAIFLSWPLCTVGKHILTNHISNLTLWFWPFWMFDITCFHHPLKIPRQEYCFVACKG